MSHLQNDGNSVNHGERLNHSVEEEFQLTLAPADWLKTSISASAPVEVVPKVNTKPADVVDEGTAVSSTVLRAFCNVLSHFKTRKPEEGAAQAEEEKVVPPSSELPAPEQPPDYELPAISTTFAAETRYAVEGRALYVWSLTDQNVGVFFDDPAELWVSFSCSEFEVKAQPLLENGEDAVHSVIKQRLSAKGISAPKIPAATLRGKNALFGAEAGEWEGLEGRGTCVHHKPPRARARNRSRLRIQRVHKKTTESPLGAGLLSSEGGRGSFHQL
eukprot:6211784-Pleurochrysis_carterae.AAC.1